MVKTFTNKTPILSVKAKPLMEPVPNQNKTMAAKRVVTFESTIAIKDTPEKPSFTRLQ